MLAKTIASENYGKHGHERLRYHAKAVDRRGALLAAELGLDGAGDGRDPAAQQQNPFHRGEASGWAERHDGAPAEEGEPIKPRKRGSLSTEEERRGGLSLYTQHLAALSQTAKQTLTTKFLRSPEARVEPCVQREIDYGDDWELERLCGGLGFETRRRWPCESRSAGEVVALSEGCAPAAVRLLPLSEAHLRQLYRCFRKIDLDGSGSVSVAEFLAFVDENPSAFVRVFMDSIVFNWAELGAEGNMNFGEFVLSVSTVCCLDRRELLSFLFDVFDADNSGAIDRIEFNELSRAIIDMGSLFPGNYGTFFASFDSNDDGAVDFDEFVKINDRFPMLFFPAAKLQDAFRRHTFSVDFWERKAAAFAKRHAGARFHSRIADVGARIVWRPTSHADCSGDSSSPDATPGPRLPLVGETSRRAPLFEEASRRALIARSLSTSKGLRQHTLVATKRTEASARSRRLVVDDDAAS